MRLRHLDNSRSSVFGSILAYNSPMEPLVLNINGKDVPLKVTPDTPLLWMLRDQMGLTGAKYGCGIGACGACTVLVDGRAEKACMLLVGTLKGAKIVTIEGLGPKTYHPLQQAWLDEDVPQCGFCQSGQIMAAASLLNKTPKPTDAQIDAAMQGNVCRCGTYPRVRKAIHRAAKAMGGAK